MSIRNFELFTGRNRPTFPNIPRVTLNRKSNFYLNDAAYLALGSPQAVVLMFDADSKAIGLKPAELSIRHAYPVRKQVNSKSYLIGGIAFVRHYSIPLEDALSFSPTVEDGIIVLEIQKAVTVTRKSRAKSQ